MNKQPSVKDKILRINWMDTGRPISKGSVEWIYDESIKELEKQHQQELKDQKDKMIQIISNRLREVGIGIQNYTEALDNPEYEEYDTMTVKKAIAHGDGLIVELKKLLKEFEGR